MKFLPFLLEIYLSIFLSFACLGATSPRRIGSESLSLRIIHTNDIHAHYSPFNKYGSDCSKNDIDNNSCYGGAARLVTTIDKLRNEHPNSLLFDAGDQAQGTLFYTIGKFNTTIKVMNLLKYDAMCIGNHEFDDGPDLLATFFAKLEFPAICANIDMTANSRLQKVVKPYIVIKKYQLGVIGYITNTTGNISKSGPTVKFTDAATAVNKYVKELRAQGIKRIIAVSHNGYHEDMDVAANTHGLDLIVGGHSHTYLALNTSEQNAGGPYPTAVKNLDGKPTYIVQAKAWGEYVGFVDIDFSRNGSVASISGKPIHMSQDISEDTDMAKRIAEWRKPFEEYGETVVGNFTTGISNADCKYKECALGDLIADAMLWAQNQVEKTDVALINGGGIRAGIGSGPTKVKDVLLVFPFGNSLVGMNVTGKQLRDIVTGAFSKTSATNGRPVTGFIQLAGVRVKYHSSNGLGQNATAGNAIVDGIEIGTEDVWNPLEDSKVYKMVTLDFIARGGDNIIDPPADPPAQTPLDVVIEDYFKTFSPITPPSTLSRMINTGMGHR
ncbi:hypothetical protein GGI07_000300 [Coemansia sp. Benny D115]|nr:hypothetical protein GGI07_000300 [Coemansia sp. Benny D115]